MKTRINTIHEEEFSDKERTLGVLLNYSSEDNFRESFVYIYRKGMYIFFNTMIEMMDYLLYAEKGMDRAYMDEETFDKYFDAPYINGKLTDILEWTNNLKTKFD